MEFNAQVAVLKGCLPCLAHKAVLGPFPHLQVHRYCFLIWHYKEDLPPLTLQVYWRGSAAGRTCICCCPTGFGCHEGSFYCLHSIT